MLRYLYADELSAHPVLADEMFRCRADQFRTRLGWDVSVDAQGHERDQYDAHDPLYVIWQQPDGGHGGSMRFLPTTGPVMVNEVFGHLTGRGPIHSPLIWECTRFCLDRAADSRVASALMLGGSEIMRGFGIRHVAGVFDARMQRIYKAIGWAPEIVGSEGGGREEISVGLWEYSQRAHERLCRRARVSPELSRLWFARAFGHRPTIPAARTA
ncbi:acyl homoserine lactone synthase [Cribrihabitans marinus]|uniref:Acyl-homoserine-lactone synthase n=1 Tax=Cribrihabitans marinus TaxID=1227549 RepID=A0A1H7CQ58_9RHOB|nr:acyl-homoserine-lactone synthase [Cribrihabitans marinus]GGH35503.1 hypothetical protein GCM10010973_28880 [Cribrihabitans marinus]SEJ88860.1 acyl homoserine lactone synthase [Cribrihabitans marinus]